MKAIIWKEWRELLRWCVIGVIGLTGIALYGIRYGVATGADNTVDQFESASPGFWIRFAAPIVALILADYSSRLILSETAGRFSCTGRWRHQGFLGEIGCRHRRLRFDNRRTLRHSHYLSYSPGRGRRSL